MNLTRDEFVPELLRIIIRSDPVILEYIEEVWKMNEEDAIKWIITPTKSGSAKLTNKDYKLMLSELYPDNWFPDGNHCLIYYGAKSKNKNDTSVNLFHKHCGKVTKKSYVCKLCETTTEGKRVLANKTFNTETYYNECVRKRRLYATSRLKTHHETVIVLPVENSKKGPTNKKVQTKFCTDYDHDSRYVYNDEYGLVLEKCFKDGKQMLVSKGIDRDNDGNIRLITKKELKNMKTTRVIFNYDSVHPSAIKYINEKLLNT